jgi:hypothetical protein
MLLYGLPFGVIFTVIFEIFSSLTSGFIMFLTHSASNTILLSRDTYRLNLERKEPTL